MRLLALLMAALVIGSAPAYADSIFIDVSETQNPTDFSHDLLCTDDAIYAPLFKQGAIVKLDRETKETLAIYHDPAGGAGQDFFQLAQDDEGRLFVTDAAHGLLWRFDPASEEWASAPLIEQIEGATYPFGYESDPSVIDTGSTTYDSGTASYVGIAFANGYIYAGLEYNAAGTEFRGVAKVDPDTLEVTRLPFDAMLYPTYMLVDGETIWMSDRYFDRLHKFDIATETIETIELEPESYPVGMAQDGSYLYVALGSFESGNSEILRVDKGTYETTIIDTGAYGDIGGAFGVHLSGNLLLWTDASGNVGTIDLETGYKTHEDSEAQRAYFGCEIDGQFWWTGEVPAMIGIMSIVAPSAPEPEPLPEPESEPENASTSSAENESDEDPPSKKGLGLGIVLGCAYSGKNCELVTALESDVVEWIKHTNVAKSNREILLILEQY